MNMLYFIEPTNTIVPVNFPLITIDLIVKSFTIVFTIVEIMLSSAFTILHELIFETYHYISLIYNHLIQHNSNDLFLLGILLLSLTALYIYDNIRYTMIYFNSIVSKIEHHDNQINMLRKYLYNFEQDINIFISTNNVKVDDYHKDMNLKLRTLSKRVKNLEKELETY